MFIRRTQTRNRTSGEPYTTYRLVQTARVGSAVKQTTLLNLGSHFDLPQEQWPGLAQRIDELLRGQASLLDPTLSDAGQALAQRYATQLIALQPSASSITPAAAAKSEPSEPGRYQEVDLDSLDLVRPRSVGVEHAVLSAMRQCGFEDKLRDLGLNRPQIAAAVGNIIARMAHPAQRAGHARVAGAALGLERADGLQLRGDGPEPPVPRFGRAAQAPRGVAGPLVRASQIDLRLR